MKPLKFDPIIYKELLKTAFKINTILSQLTSMEFMLVERQLRNIKDPNHFIAKIQHNISKLGYCVIHDAPVDNIKNIPTPLPDDLYCTNIAAITLVWILTALNSRVCGIEGVKDGALFHNIVPTHDPSGFSSINDAAWDRSLGFHQEMAFMNRKGVSTVPQYVVLLCLRGGEGDRPFTYAVSTMKLLKILPKETTAILHLPLFIVRAPERFHWFERPQSLLYSSNNFKNRCLTYSGLYTGSFATVEASEIACKSFNLNVRDVQTHLKELENAYQKVDRLQVCFKEGDLVILDNRIVQHARSQFTPNLEDRTKVRWLLRAYGIEPSIVPFQRVLNISSRLKEIQELAI